MGRSIYDYCGDRNWIYSLFLSQRGFRTKALIILKKILRNPDVVDILENNTLNDFVFDIFIKLKEVTGFKF